MIRQINIIPTDASDTYRNALGYAWQDYENKIPGEDRRGEFKVYQQAILELEAQGITCIDATKCGRLPEGAVIVARITCMWCGGGSLIGYTLPATAEATEAVATETVEPAVVEHGHGTGYCYSCESYCFGDCGDYTPASNAKTVKRELDEIRCESTYGIIEE